MSNSSNLHPNNSPNGNNNSNVRRLNKLPIILICAALFLVMFGLLYALNSRQHKDDNNTAENLGNSVVGNNEMVQALTAGIGDGVVDSHSKTVVIDNTKPTPKVKEQEQLTPDIPEKPQEPKIDEEAERIKKLVQQFREQNFQGAIVARTAIEEQPKYNKDKEKEADRNSGNVELRATSSNPQLAKLLQSMGNQGIGGQTSMESLLESQDPNLRLRKDSFAAKTDNPYKYSTAARVAQLTPYEIRVGSIIPAVMVSGINSDLPGDIIAQVSQDVRDSKTGRHILIPYGSKLIGKYDSHIAMGQERVMIAWYRLQFPDASILDLDNMGAVDLAGYSGMHDKVNNHTWKIFKNAFLLSVIGAGMQVAISDEKQTGYYNENSPTNTLKAEMGRQFGQVGTEMVRKNLNIQPTLEIRPGYKFNVMVNKDLILKPYQAM